MSTLVYIYGTLKSGHVRHSALREERYIGISKTAPKYIMYQYGSYPALTEVADGHKIYGELYEVSDACMMELDKIEGTANGLFARKEIELEEVTLSQLPVDEAVWIKIANKKAVAYVFQNLEKLRGARDCGQMWFLK